MKYLIIFILALLPFFAQAQLLRAYGVVEIGSTFPTSSVTGAKFAYRTTDSSFYRWIHTNVWVKVAEPSIIPDTLYLQQISGTTAIVNGDTINLTPYVLKTDTTSILAPYIKLAGWGLMKLTSTLQVDTSKVATKYYASTSPTSISANYIATSNGTNLVARNLFDNNTYVGVISRPWKFGEWTTAGRPTGVNGYTGFNTSFNWLDIYSSSGWFSPLQSSLTGGLGTAGSLLFLDANGRATQSNSQLFWDNTNNRLGVGTNSIAAAYKMQVNGAIYSNNVGGVNYYMTNGSAIRTVDGASNMYIDAFNSSANCNLVLRYGTALSGSVTFGGTLVDFNSNVEADWVRVVTSPAPSGLTGHGFELHQFTSSGFGFGELRQVNRTGTVYGNTITNRFGGTFVIGSLITTSGTYSMYNNTTSAEIIPVGTTAQTPTEIGGLFRFNSDSTLYQIYSSGARNYVATRAYARSLVSGLPTTWLKPELDAGRDVTINGTSASDFTLNHVRVKMEDTLTVGDSILHTTFTSPYRFLFSKAAIRLGNRGDNLSTIDFWTGNNFTVPSDWGIVNVGDELDFIANGGSAVALRLFDNYDFVFEKFRYQSGTFAFMPTSKTTMTKELQLTEYGVGNKEASDLSKTQSNYITSFATDGTVVEMEDLHVATTGLVTMDEYDNSASFTPNAIGEEASELFLTTSASTGKVLQRKMRETSWTNSNASVTDDMLELAQDVFIYANCLAIATDSTVIDLPTPSSDYIGQIVEVCGDGRNATPNYQVYVRGVGATLWHQAGGADPSAQTYLEVTNLSSNHNTVKFICAQPNGSTYYWILLKQQ